SSEIHMWIPPIWYALHQRTVTSLLGTLRDFTEKAIHGRMKERDDERARRNAEKRGDGDDEEADDAPFLDGLLDLLDQGLMSFEEVQNEVDTFVFAGHDTTSTTLGWLMWCLACNPQHQDKVYDEILARVGEEDGFVSDDDIKHMPYLDMCIKETLRIYAVAPFTERLVEGDFNLDGYTIPDGSEIFLSPMLLHHNETVFKDSWAFDPERFGPKATHAAFDYVPFAAGPRNCIGQKFAMKEVKTVAVWFLRAFRVSTKRDMESNVPAPEVILRPLSNFVLQITNRK
ncbi:hypothetical protein PFISCL1PPCAC_26648, partial [Pristionchus fissidentatus]